MVKKKSCLTAVIAVVISVLCALCLFACGTGDDAYTENIVLDTPQNLRIVSEVLRWDEVKGADGYEVEIDEQIYKTETTGLDTFKIMCEPKTYSLRVKAISGKGKSSWSDAIEYGIEFPTMLELGLINGTEYAIRAGLQDGVKNKLIIPSAMDGKPITKIVDNAFKDCKYLTSVLIPDTVTSIGEYAFAGCKNLEAVRLPAGLKNVSWRMFLDCSNLKSVEMPEGLEEISHDAFMNCKSMTEINIPSSVKTICSHVFDGCSLLKEIKLPKSLNQIGSGVFANCDSLESLSVDIENKRLVSDNNCVIRSSTDVLECGIKTSVIPDYVQYVGADAFSGCVGLTEVTIPGNVKSIGHSAFRACTSLKKVTVESGVKSIGGAFSGCTSLEEVIFPDTLTTVNTGIFIRCVNLKSITIEGNATDPVYKSDGNCIIRIADNTMVAGCLWSDIPDYVEGILGCFDEMPVTHITVKTNNSADKEYGVLELPSGLKSISGFNDCQQLRTIQLPDSLTSISGFAQSDCIETVIIPENCKVDFGNKDVLGKATVYASCDTVPDCFGLRDVIVRKYRVITGCDFGDDDGRLYVDSFVWNENLKAENKNPNSIPVFVPYRKGYTFKGWAKDSRTGDVLDELKTFDRTSSVTYNSSIYNKGEKVGESTGIDYNDLLDLPLGTTLYAVWEPESVF